MSEEGFLENDGDETQQSEVISIRMQALFDMLDTPGETLQLAKLCIGGQITSSEAGKLLAYLPMTDAYSEEMALILKTTELAKAESKNN